MGARVADDFGRRVLASVAAVALVAALLVGAAVGIAAALQHLPAAAPAVPAPPPPAWREIVKPVRIYSLEAPAFAKLVPTYAARRHTDGGGREDLMTLGTPGQERLALRLRIFRRGAEAATGVPLIAALAHEAAEAGLSVAHSGLPDMLPTRFGRFEIADVMLARQAGAALPCGGFRLMLDKPALSITGLACGAGTAAMPHAEIACLLERLDVAAARDDRELIDFFAASELRRDVGCSGMRLGPDGLHAPWLDDKPAAKAPDPAAHIGKAATSRKSLRHR